MSSSERNIFPDTTDGKWWIINTLTTDRQGHAHHRCLLLSSEYIQDKNFVTFYSAQWSASDSVYANAFHHSVQPRVNLKYVFPMNIEVPESDWNWKLSRKKMQWQVSMQDSAKGWTVPQAVKLNMKKQSPFNLMEMMKDPEVWNMSPVRVKDRSNGKDDSNSEGYLFMSVLKGKEIFLNTANHRSVVWTDLILNTGEKWNLLFTVSAEGELIIIASSQWGPNGSLVKAPPPKIETDERSIILNLHEGKRYPLCYQISNSGGIPDFLLKPVHVEQELSLKNNSLWMGGIDIVETGTGKRMGFGNMYIFKQ
ncbi:MAG: hypothetical protein JNJ58_08475 [Chitinophagaceae bacterium]|nr:hypothetical protein [Chitinophagaceae bacterium]